ncbi:MAG TPA: hypothetical protein PLY72_19185 [Candidatus Obscuribacter sp.]|nr:hypothetical protein [Candidatus Obscuribacter sp.]
MSIALAEFLGIGNLAMRAKIKVHLLLSFCMAIGGFAVPAALLASLPCAQAAPVESGDAKSGGVKSPAGKSIPVSAPAPASAKNEASLFRLLDELQRSRPFTREKIESLTGHRLIEKEVGEYSSDTSNTTLVASVKAPFDTSKTIGGVVLLLNRGKGLARPAMLKRYGRHSRRFYSGRDYPSRVKEPTVLYSYKTATGFLQFEFTRSPAEELVSCAVLDSVK